MKHGQGTVEVVFNTEVGKRRDDPDFRLWRIVVCYPDGDWSSNDLNAGPEYLDTPVKAVRVRPVTTTAYEAM